MEFEYKPHFCFVFPLYRNLRCHSDGEKRSDYLVRIYRKVSDSRNLGYAIAIEEITPYETPKDLEKINSQFSKIFCNFEVLVNFYDFLSYAQREVFLDLAVEIFRSLISKKLDLLSGETIDNGDQNRELFERIWEEFKDYYYSNDLEDLL